ncbi:rolling circle replication-associated protein, partial [Clostridium perfringens]|uniref:rolling circle replication-associated protein n=1 Tax=Clostridium perfringens TaxID=1502 RepID=UPI002AC7E630
MDNTIYNLKIISSGSNRIELYKVSNYLIRKNGKSNNKQGRRGKEDLENNEKVENSKRNRKTTLTNTRNNIIRLIKSNEDMKTFITLTFEKETDYKESKILLNNLFNKLRRKYNNLKYLWVLEFGTKNQRLHYHLLTNIELPININFSKSCERKSEGHKEFERNFSEKYWPYGFVDIRNLDQEGNTNIALYVSCYIVKDLLDKQLEGYRVYGYSRKTLDKPTVSKIYDDRSLEELLKEFS